jgi:hypothetical protein
MFLQFSVKIMQVCFTFQCKIYCHSHKQFMAVEDIDIEGIK